MLLRSTRDYTRSRETPKSCVCDGSESFTGDAGFARHPRLKPAIVGALARIMHEPAKWAPGRAERSEERSIFAEASVYRLRNTGNS